MKSRQILSEWTWSRKESGVADRPRNQGAASKWISTTVTSRAATPNKTGLSYAAESTGYRLTGDARSFDMSRLNFNNKTMDVKMNYLSNQPSRSQSRKMGRGDSESRPGSRQMKGGYGAELNKFAIKVHLKRAGMDTSLESKKQSSINIDHNRSKSAYQSHFNPRQQKSELHQLSPGNRTLQSERDYSKVGYLDLATVIVDEEKINFKPKTGKHSSNSGESKYRKTAPVKSFLRSTTNNLAGKVGNLLKDKMTNSFESSMKNMDDPREIPIKIAFENTEEENENDESEKKEKSSFLKSEKFQMMEEHGTKSGVSNPSKIAETSFYENYPIALASKILKDPILDYSSNPIQFLDKYSKTLDNFIFEFFVREDGMLYSLETGQPYINETQKKIREEMKALARKEREQNAPIIFDTRLCAGEMTFSAQNRSESVRGPGDKYVAMAEEAFQKAFADMKETEEATSKVKEGIHFTVDMRANMPRYKNNMFPNEVQEVEEFYRKLSTNHKPSDIEVKNIGDLVKNLNFFKKIDEESRNELIIGAHLIKYEPGDFVVKQGEHGNSMFIILFGAANVMINGIHPKTKQPHKFRVASLPDGSSFGEYSLLNFPAPPMGGSTIWQSINLLKSTLNPKGIKNVLEIVRREKELAESKDEVTVELVGKAQMTQLLEERHRSNYQELLGSMRPPFIPNTRAASIQVYETSYMLEVSASLFKTAIVEKIKNEMTDKIRILSLQTFFTNHSGINFVPMAMLMKRVEYKYGQVIIRSGEIPSSLLCIKSGTVEVVSIMKRSREINTGIYSHVSRKPLRNMNFQYKMNHAIDINEKKKLELIDLEECSAYEHARRANIHSDRLFIFDPVNEKDTTNNRMQYYDFFVSKRLFQGDALFTRSLYSKDIAGDGYLIEGKDPEIEPSRLSVVASSAKVICYELKKNLVVFIPEPTKSILLREVKKLMDHDIEVTSDAVNNMTQWDDYKEHVYINQLLLRQLNKKEDAYKKY